MAWSPVLLTLLAHCTGSWAQSVLTQPPSVSGALGQSIGGDSVNWPQQLSGRAHRLVIYQNSNCASGVPDRFSDSKSGSSDTMTITGLNGPQWSRPGGSETKTCCPPARGLPGQSCPLLLQLLPLSLCPHRQPQTCPSQLCLENVSPCSQYLSPKPVFGASTLSELLRWSRNPWVLVRLPRGQSAPGL
uniref:Uncharacterized protein n=1 Tax=Catagonus wagneri TaxID=51154 RepID=A0A8C3YGB0_9CETA